MQLPFVGLLSCPIEPIFCVIFSVCTLFRFCWRSLTTLLVVVFFSPFFAEYWKWETCWESNYFILNANILKHLVYLRGAQVFNGNCGKTLQSKLLQVHSISQQNVIEHCRAHSFLYSALSSSLSLSFLLSCVLSYIKFAQPFQSVRRDFGCVVETVAQLFRCLVSIFNVKAANIIGSERERKIFVVSFKICFVCTFLKTVKIHFTSIRAFICTKEWIVWFGTFWNGAQLCASLVFKKLDTNTLDLSITLWIICLILATTCSHTHIHSPIQLLARSLTLESCSLIRTNFEVLCRNGETRQPNSVYRYVWCECVNIGHCCCLHIIKYLSHFSIYLLLG